MDYLYDVFVSYRRHREWTPWTREHICNLLDAYLTQDMSGSPRIFVDDKIEPGADWPNRLGDSLARARVLLVIFSGDYFRSDWCLHELDLMHSRLARFPNCKLIVPVVVHDGDLIPDEIGRLQPVDLKAYRNTDLQRRTPCYQEFSEAIKGLAPHVADAIASAPPFEDSWIEECRERFNEVYAMRGGGTSLPVKTLTLKKPLARPVTSPRVTL